MRAWPYTPKNHADGPPLSSGHADPRNPTTPRDSHLGRWEELAGQISQPLSDDEVTVLAGLLPADESDAFGMAWTLTHVLESAPGWPVPGALESAPAYWGGVLRTRLDNPRSRPLGN